MTLQGIAMCYDVHYDVHDKWCVKMYVLRCMCYDVQSSKKIYPDFSSVSEWLILRCEVSSNGLMMLKRYEHHNVWIRT